MWKVFHFIYTWKVVSGLDIWGETILLGAISRDELFCWDCWTIPIVFTSMLRSISPRKVFPWFSTLFFLSFTMKVSGIVLGRNENQWREAKTTERSFRFHGDVSGGAPLVLRQQLDRRWSLNPGFGIVNRGKIISDGSPHRISTYKSHLISFQQIGASLNDYPNLKRWFAQCATDVKGYDENEEGAKLFGDKVKSLLQDKLWTAFCCGSWLHLHLLDFLEFHQKILLTQTQASCWDIIKKICNSRKISGDDVHLEK